MAKNSETAGDAPVIIKKYANRRLYNTSKSSYVTLEDLSAMVRAGEEFVVHDAKSKEDITRSVLAQIIFDEEAKGQNMLPVSFLRQLISLYGDTLQGVVPGYLEASMDSFSRNQEQIREQVASAFSANPAFGGIEAMARTNMEFFENAMKMFSPFGVGQMPNGQAPTDQAMPSAAVPDAEPPREKGELDELKAQLAQMQDQLSKIAKTK